MPPPLTPHAGASTPGRDDLIVVCWNVGMPDRNSFRSRVGEAMEDVRVAISEMVTWDVDIIGLNEVHPDFFSMYDRTITSAFPNMKFLGVPSGDAFVWRASCRLVSIVRVRGVTNRVYAAVSQPRASVMEH